MPKEVSKEAVGGPANATSENPHPHGRRTVQAEATGEMSTAAAGRTGGTAETFSAFYLGEVTSAFSDDLDKVRDASDFSNASLPLLVLALQQGEGCFSDAEKAMVESTLKDSEH